VDKGGQRSLTLRCACEPCNPVPSPLRHALRCGRGVCVFIVVRLSATLVVAERRHSWWGSLYLDCHGEEDRGLLRGRPLTLNEGRVRSLEELWYGHGLREYVCLYPSSFPLLALLPRRPAPPVDTLNA